MSALQTLMTGAADADVKRVSRTRVDIPSEDGFSIVEVLVASLVLVLVVIGTLGLFDEAQRTSAENRGRSTVASLAEQDMENLRATAATTLGGDAATGRKGFTRTTTQSVADISYTITSKAQWTRDATEAVPSCTDDDGIAEYIKLTSTVDDTSGANTRVKPYTLTSLLAPRFGSFGRHVGSLSVALKNSRQPPGPVTGVPVSISGPTSASDNTNDAGCAIFSYFPSGDYTMSWTAAGYVDPNGVSTPTGTATITDNDTRQKTYFYDDAATLTANVKTKGGADAFAPVVTFGNDGMTAFPTGRSFPTTVTGTTYKQIGTGRTMYPFVDGYTAYTGNCSANKPSSYSGQTTANVSTLVGGQSASIDVYQPPVVVYAYTGSGTRAVQTAVRNAVFTPSSGDADLGCTLKYKVSTTTGSPTAVTGSIPYGTYNLCIDNGSRRTVVPTTTTYANTALNTGITAIVDMNTTTAGTCT